MRSLLAEVDGYLASRIAKPDDEDALPRPRPARAVFASENSALIRAQLDVYRQMGTAPLLWPRNPGSWPGYVFTGAPLKLPAGGHGDGAHGPNEYFLIDSMNAKVLGLSGAVRSFVEYLFALAVVG